MNKWQPIDTVPEMVDVLIYIDEETQKVGHCAIDDLDGFYDEPVRLWNVDGGWEIHEGVINPTHWMPLPDPPQMTIETDDRRMRPEDLTGTIKRVKGD
jgi:Protein of unknown function (DUF551)